MAPRFVSPLPLNEAADRLCCRLVVMRFQPAHQLVAALLVALGLTTCLFVFGKLTPSIPDPLDFTILLCRL